MVNGLHLYGAFIDLMATKALYIFALHSPTHTPTAVSPYKAPSSSSGAAGVRKIAENDH